MKVYLVEVGEYSDRYIAKVFESEEKAKKFVELATKYKLSMDYGYGNVNILEYETSDSDCIFNGDAHYVQVTYYENGNFIIGDELYGKPFETEYININQYSRYKAYTICLEAGRYDRYKDKDKICKICQDRIAEWKAKQAGIA